MVGSPDAFAEQQGGGGQPQTTRSLNSADFVMESKEDCMLNFGTIHKWEATTNIGSIYGAPVDVPAHTAVTRQDLFQGHARLEDTQPAGGPASAPDAFRLYFDNVHCKFESCT